MQTITQRLAARVTQRRGDLSFRKAAEQVGIPFSTLRRIELGGVTTLENVAKLMVWAAIDPRKLFAGDE